MLPSRKKLLVILAVLIILRVLTFFNPVQAYGIVYTELGDKALSKNDLKTAMKQYQRAVFHNPRYHPANYQLGRLYGEQGDEKKRIFYWERAVANGTEHTDAIYTMGIFYLHHGNRNEAVRCFERSIQIDRYWLPPRLELAELYFDWGIFEKAIEGYENYLGYENSSQKVRYKLGLLYLYLHRETNCLSQVHYLLDYHEKGLSDQLFVKLISPLNFLP